jgi:four helix bundle protein
MLNSFDHEKLKVYQAAISFVSWCQPLIERAPKRIAVFDQLDRSSTSIALNIAEGNGKFSIRDRCRFLDIARGSALESAACLDVLIAKKQFTQEELEQGKRILVQIVSMLIGLIQSFSNEVREEAEEYHRMVAIKSEHEQEQE